MYFPLNSEKFARAPFLKNTPVRLLLYYVFLSNVLDCTMQLCSKNTSLKGFYCNLRPVETRIQDLIKNLRWNVLLK